MTPQTPTWHQSAPNRPDPICELIRAERKRRGWSLDTFAKKTGVAAVVIGAYERGDRQANVRQARYLFEKGLGGKILALTTDPDSDAYMEYAVVYGTDQYIECEDEVEAKTIVAHMPGAVVVHRTHQVGLWSR